MSSLPAYKDIINLIKTGATIEAQEKIMELRESALVIQEENITLRNKISELEAELSKRTSVTWDAPYYWTGLEENREGPFCQHCYDKDASLVRLQQSGTRGSWDCLACENHYRDKNYSPTPVRQMPRATFGPHNMANKGLNRTTLSCAQC